MSTLNNVRSGLRLTPDLLKSHIAEVIYEDREVGGHRVITCHLKMDNGFVVWGKNSSTSIDPENFDEELGKTLAYEKTFSQLWELEAYRAVVEKRISDAQAAALVEFDIDIDQYISKRGEIYEMAGASHYLRGNGQDIAFHHPNDPTRGFVSRFIRTDNEHYDEEHNSKSRDEVKNYLISFMDAKDLNQDLVVRIAKTCVAAHRGGLHYSSPTWERMNNIEQKECCDHIKKLLLAPPGYIPEDQKDALFKAIVDSYK